MRRKTLLFTALAFVLILCVVGALYRRLAAQYPDAVPTETEVSTVAADGDAVTAPDFSMLNADGESVKLSDFIGTPVVLNFWATWCPPCRGELPYFAEAFAEYGDRVAFLMTDLTDEQSETVETVQAFLAEQGYVFPVYYDAASEGAYAYGVSAIPTTYFLNADGTIHSYQIGALTKDLLYDRLERLLE